MHHERICWKGIFKKRTPHFEFFVDLLPWVFEIGTNSLPFWDKRRWPLLQLWRFHATKGAPRGPPLFFHQKKTAYTSKKKQVGRLSVLLPAFSWRFFCEKCFKVKIEDIFFQVFPFKKRITYWIPTKFFRIFVSWMASSSPSMEIVVWTPAAGLRFGVLINKQ